MMGELCFANNLRSGGVTRKYETSATDRKSFEGLGLQFLVVGPYRMRWESQMRSEWSDWTPQTTR